MSRISLVNKMPKKKWFTLIFIFFFPFHLTNFILIASHTHTQPNMHKPTRNKTSSNMYIKGCASVLFAVYLREYKRNVFIFWHWTTHFIFSDQDHPFKAIVIHFFIRIYPQMHVHVSLAQNVSSPPPYSIPPASMPNTAHRIIKVCTRAIRSDCLSARQIHSDTIVVVEIRLGT